MHRTFLEKWSGLSVKTLADLKMDLKDYNREQLREIGQRLCQFGINFLPEKVWEEWVVLFAPPYIAHRSASSRSQHPRTFTLVQTQPVEERKDAWQRSNIVQADTPEPQKTPRATHWLREEAQKRREASHSTRQVQSPPSSIYSFGLETSSELPSLVPRRRRKRRR